MPPFYTDYDSYDIDKFMSFTISQIKLINVDLW